MLLRSINLFYSGTQAVLSHQQKNGSPNQNLILHLQKVAMILDATLLAADYFNFYEKLKVRMESVKEQKWYHNELFWGLGGIVGFGCLSALAVSYLNRSFKPAIDISKMITHPDPKMSLDWCVPKLHKISQWLILHRAFVNMSAGILSSQKSSFAAGLLQLVTVVNRSSLRWVRVEKSIEASLSSAHLTGRFKGQAAFDFLMPAVPLSHEKEHLQTSVSMIYDYIKDNLKIENYIISIRKGFLTGLRTNIAPPSFKGCSCNVNPILDGYFYVGSGWATFTGTYKSFIWRTLTAKDAPISFYVATR